MDALGGQARWDALPGLQWTFRAVLHDTVKAVRRHSWEKHTGRHRVDGTEAGVRKGQTSLQATQQHVFAGG